MERKNKCERNTRIEMLRIISMLAIVSAHYVDWFYIPQIDTNIISINRLLLEFLRSASKIGVNVFVLISGYFLSESQMTKEKIIKICIPVWFYSIFLDLIGYIVHIRELSFLNVLDTVLPILFNKHWFVTVILGLYILSPYINKLIEGLSKKEHLNLCVLLLFMNSIIPTFLTFEYFFSNIAWFVTLYIIASYIRKYLNEIHTKKIIYVKSIAILSYLLILLSILVLDCLGTKISIAAEHRFYFASCTSVLTTICSISLLIISINLKTYSNRRINTIAGTMFAVYLIHCSEIARKIWELLKPVSIENKYVLIQAITMILLMTAICVVVELCRKKIHDMWSKVKNFKGNIVD